ncbi:TMV resistance protein N-like isoform X2 [Lycium barbarum]|uniref:TMV resistance protein N-like isoform X2 n=1 Tax=Lycium barbarum TaxID=112863 RepID=UPI00293E21AD|nr:TMV resistance protein N-like isoform X2 [Lycium barbarum]
MASSSSTRSLQLPQRKYDVFLSFRGEDTRKNFTSHLHEVLRNRGIFTFLDEERLEHGDSIPDELVKAIKDSQVAVIIFSKKYATSRWCLNELVKIMECKDNNKQTVIPVFYNVNPSDVRNQRESFAEAFAKHESNYKDDIEGMQKVQGWKKALSEVANLKGCDTCDRIESECIRELVDQISSKLRKTSSSYLQTVVGIDTHLKEVNSLLKMEIDDVRIVGIWGMGGIGKTTIARAIFDTLYYQFEAASFLANIKENEKKYNLHSLQNTLLSDLLRRKDNYVSNEYDGKNMIQSRLHSLKVLIVLDDVDHSDHLENLAGDHGWFGNGSRVIVTTRYRHLIENDDAIYEVPILPDREAGQLFNQYAFKKEVPNDLFTKLSSEVVNHAKGLPLALKVWGSLLRKKGLTQWRRTVDQIKKNSNLEIVEKLKISYDGLEREEKRIFLDIACFFRGYKKEKVMQILESCGFGAKCGLDVLIEKSLVFLSKYDEIEMHDLIQDMGKYIVKMQKDAGECSRLWDSEDFEEVMGTKAMEAIWVRHIQKLCLSKKAMKKMKKLRMLCIMGFDTYDGSIEYLPNSLRWFVLKSYPWESLPQKFEPERLIYLDLERSSLRHLWTGIKRFPYLRELNLTGSEHLMRTPDFKGMPNLEYLDLSDCTNLEEVDESLGYCSKLIKCDLWDCSSLKRFPCVNLESLKYLGLRLCSSLEEFPEVKGRSKLGLKIKIEGSGGWLQIRGLLIKIDGSGIREIPSSFFQFGAHFTKLYLNFLEHLVALPSSIGTLKSLVKLDVSDCSRLEILPEEIEYLENLEKLDAHNTLISRPPSSIIHLNKLKLLNFKIKESQVGLVDRVCFEFPRVKDGLRALKNLNLNNCNLIDGGLPEDIGSLSSLEALSLKGNNFEHLPLSIAQLGALRFLCLSDCKRLKELPRFMGMPNLDSLDLGNCNDLEEVDDSLGYCGKLFWLKLDYCTSLKRFPCVNVESLNFLYLRDCSSLEKFPEIRGRMNLKLKIEMKDSGIRELPSSYFQSGTHLTKLDLSFMKHFVALPSSIGMLKSLVELNVCFFSSLEILPEEIGDLENLEKLDARGTLISRPPSSIARLNKLKFLSFTKHISEVGLQDGVCFVFPSVNDGLRSLERLYLSYCNLKDGGLPEDIGSLSSLKELYLNGNNFENLPRSIAQLGALRILDVSDCLKLTQLPEFPQQLVRIDADWSNDWICNSLFQNISSLQHHFSASDSLSLRVFISGGKNIPSWFHHQGKNTIVSVNLPENWAYAEEFMR